MKYGEYFIQLLASSASLTFYKIGKQLELQGFKKQLH